ncbi:MAG: 23S rRNA (pseudouridine(1915)-N(3))-methyltransferase RlmH [Bdellovibrionales bacterium]|nr:23S rRNA (pseudouridine(1915)-N(3))-methyltransferase RlmH [Bdellovibrionales bacterium]
MQVVCIAVNDQKEDWFNLLAAHYSKKIKPYAKFEIQWIKPFRESREDLEKKIQKEAENILNKIESNDVVVVCDERGEALSSIKFAKKIEHYKDTIGSRRVVFIVGGAYGLDVSIKKRANMTLQLSTMVMNHHVAAAMLFEQIYRAFTIINKIPYHNE